MKLFFHIPSFISCLLLLSSCAFIKNESFKTDPKLVKVIHTNFFHAAKQYKVLMQRLPAGRFPKTYHAKEDRLETSGSEWWCSGFYPGSLLYLFEQEKDSALYHEAMRALQLLEKQKYNTRTHDLGFMMFCSFGHARTLSPTPAYDSILLTSATSLATRFNPMVGCIKSWDAASGDFLVIIDNMMNLELLFWATKKSGDSSFYNIAVQHANTTIEHHFRRDYSAYHVVNYNPQTGAVQQKRTAQGFADESAWARGQAWGLYGFVVTFRETGHKKYLDQANAIARFLLQHPNMPADKIPYWDLNATDIPHTWRDASAAAIIAAALLELCRYVDVVTGKTYFQTAETIIKTLSIPHYKAAAGSNGGFILKHGVGHLPQKSEVDVPLTYADYYFLQAMKRYLAFNKQKGFETF